MIVITFRKLISTALIFITIFCTAAAALGGYSENGYVLTAEAATAKTTQPKISVNNTYGDKIEIKLENASSYKAGTIIYIYSNAGLCKKADISSVKANKGVISLFHTGIEKGKYYTPSKTYRIKAKAVYKGTGSDYSSIIKAKTESAAYYAIDKGVQLYSLNSGKIVKSSKADTKQYVICRMADAKGVKISGLSADKHGMIYAKITEGKYYGKYVKLDGGKNVRRINEKTAKRMIVSQYAASMNGGTYVYGGASYRATDCSGLTMQAYNRIGVNISHSVYTQATMGKAVSTSSMQPGDLLILNNYSHVAMYIGNDKMVHAMNSYDGIKIQPISYLQYYRINTVRRII